MSGNTGRNLRLKRLHRYNNDHLLIVPLDHSVANGPFASNKKYNKILHNIANSGADAVVLHKGRLRDLTNEVYKKLSVIVHVSASTTYASDVDDKYIVASVEDAVRRGADGISVHVNLGSKTESKQLRDLAQVAESCESNGIPLLAMMYARGERISELSSLETLSHAAALAGDLGADIVKLALPNNAEKIQWITSHSPIPVIAAGGSKLDEADFLGFVRRVMLGGGTGMAAGRNIFMSEDIPRLIEKTRSCLNRKQPILELQY